MKIPAALDLQCGKKGDQKPCDDRRDAYYEESLTEQSTANAGIRIAYLDESDLCLSDSDQSHNDNGSIPGPYSEVVQEVTSPDYSESSVPIRYYEKSPPRDPEEWSNQIDYFFSVSSLALNLTSILHFASCAAKNGGGAFCVAYLVLMMVCGLPMAYLETCIGQYAKGGPVVVWNIMPIAKGISWAMLIVTVLIAMYYSVIMSWSVFYAGMSIIQPLPWICSKTYTNSNHPVCDSSFPMSNSYTYQHDVNQKPLSLFLHMNTTNTSLTTAIYSLPSGTYFQQTLLLQSEKSMSGNWQLVLCLLVTWLLVFLILIKGIHSMAKILYFT
ncbi:sodium-dependent dopamine transporter-like, partial [Argonauta hians]